MRFAYYFVHGKFSGRPGKPLACSNVNVQCASIGSKIVGIHPDSTSNDIARVRETAYAMSISSSTVSVDVI